MANVNPYSEIENYYPSRVRTILNKKEKGLFKIILKITTPPVITIIHYRNEYKTLHKICTKKKQPTGQNLPEGRRDTNLFVHPHTHVAGLQVKQ